MEEKAIQLIKTRMERLSSDDFDLEAWKSGTIAVLKRFFEAADPRIKDIENLKIDYSSWALRDSNSKYNPVETCKKKGGSILEAMLDEIEVMGLRDQEASNSLGILASGLQGIDERTLQDASQRQKALKSLKKEQLIEIIEQLLR
ncbi:MAG: hypothetical protein AAGA85_09190 [Bacteroidota bacterium]